MKEEELRIVIHIYKDVIIGIDAEQDSFKDGVHHLGGKYPYWSYVVPVTVDTDLHIKLMRRLKEGGNHDY